MLRAYSCIKSPGCHDASDVTTYRATVIGVSAWGVPGNDDSVSFIITETEGTDHRSVALSVLVREEMRLHTNRFLASSQPPSPCEL
jgi:hypothetical protein